MKPGESVAKSLRRLGGGNKKMTSAQRLKAKKQGIKPTAEELKNQELFQKLTGLADTLIQTGRPLTQFNYCALLKIAARQQLQMFIVLS